jgi:hypothetical protein
MTGSEVNRPWLHVLSLGVIYFGLIVRTFHRYGDPLDRAWMRVVNEWMKDTLDPRQNPYSAAQQPSSGAFNASLQSATRDGVTSKFQHAYQTQAAAPLVRALAEEGSSAAPPGPLTKLSPSAPLTSRPSAFLKTPRPAASQPMIPFTVMQLGHRDIEARITGHANPTWSGAIDADDWTRFILVRFLDSRSQSCNPHRFSVRTSQVLGMNSFHSRDHKPALPAPTFPPTPYYHRLDVPIQRPIQSTLFAILLVSGTNFTSTPGIWRLLWWCSMIHRTLRSL